jgi:hypothetical protein
MKRLDEAGSECCACRSRALLAENRNEPTACCFQTPLVGHVIPRSRAYVSNGTSRLGGFIVRDVELWE